MVPGDRPSPRRDRAGRCGPDDLPDPARSARLPDVQGPSGLGVTPAFRHDGFDTRDWLVGKAAEIPERADPTTGFAPRGAVVEQGAPAFPYTETERDRVWAHNVASLYEQATASQWDASADIRWRDLEPSVHLERAVCRS